MVFPAASAVPGSRVQTALPKEKFCLFHSSFPINVHQRHVSVTYSAKFPRMQYFPDSTKFIVFLNYTRDKLWEFVPGSVKQFPWKKAGKVTLHELHCLGKEALKWTLLAYFALACPSDILYSLSRNKELVIPLGLFVGCMMTNYFNEVASEFMSNHKGDVFTWKFLGISFFFVAVKFFSLYSLGGSDFLLHVANGGLMQLLWNWKNLPQVEGESSSWDDASATTKTDS